MPFAAYPARLVTVGLVKEGSYGAGGAPAQLLRCTVSPVDQVGFQVDTGWRGAAVATFGRVVASIDAGLRLSGPLATDSFGYLLAGALGDVTVTGPPSPYIWSMSVQNAGTQQSSSYAVAVVDPTGPLTFPGCVVRDLEVAFGAEELVTWQATLAGLVPTTGAVTMPAASGDLPLPAWTGRVQIAGVTTTAVLDGKISLKRAVTAKRRVDGSLSPWLQRQEPLEVSGTLTVVAQDDTLRQGFISGAQTSLDVVFATGAGAATRSLQLHCSAVTWSGVTRSYGGKFVELAGSFVADGNAADVGASGGWSPIKATLLNGVASGY